jgi:aldehyde:ferredoxin oxidoreductase
MSSPTPRAVERGKYPTEALPYRMAVKGLFQSDPHDARILKAFALGLAVATRGMDHLRNRVTSRSMPASTTTPNSRPRCTAASSPPSPTATSARSMRYAAARTPTRWAMRSVMCRFNTKLFNSPSLPDLEDFSRQLNELTGLALSAEELDEVGRNIMGVERLINARLGLGAADDTLPPRWFEEPLTVGPFAGERIDRQEFEALKRRFYAVSGLNGEGHPAVGWHEQLARVITGFAIKVTLPSDLPGGAEGAVVIDQPVANVSELREALKRKLPKAATWLDDRSLSVAVDGEFLLSGEHSAPLRSGAEVTLTPMLAGG